MIAKKMLTLLVAGTAAAQRPSNVPICDYYTTALLKDNTAANQYTLLTLLVNTVVIGNYTMPNVGVAVPGILAQGMYNGTAVNLLPYFDGTLASSNRGGDVGQAVNFLDGGGASPLTKNLPANDDKSNQYFLLTHLYQFFGALLGCTQYGQGAFPPYTGTASMYQVHKFMDLNPYQLGYFITQVALAGASFGVAQSDLMAVGTALGNLFGLRCSAPMTAIPAQGPQLQAICIDGSCPLSPSPVCAQYAPVMVPRNVTSGQTKLAPGSVGAANSTTSPNASTSATGTSKPTTVPTGAVGHLEVGFISLAAAGVVAAVFI